MRDGPASTWTARPMDQAPADRRILVADRRGNFSVAAWGRVDGRGEGWVVSRGRGVAIVFENPIAWFDLPDFVPPEDLR